ncbi:MAG: COR domain-containing protein [archaeon]|nr:COR domain-containing protein [archaeon]
MKRNAPASGELDVALQALRSDQRVTELNLRDNGLRSQGAIAIFDTLATNSTVLSLSISSNHLEMETMPGLTEMLRRNNTLTRLDLCQNFLPPGAASGIGEGLMVNSTLQYLDLRLNCLGGGIEQLALGLRDNRSLVSLCLSQNRITDSQISLLGKALAHHGTLRELDLSSNEITGCTGMVLLLAAERLSLQKLDLSSNKIGCKGAHCIAGGLQMNSTLNSLVFTSNEISVDGFDALFSALTVNTVLQVLNMSRQLMDDDCATHVASYLAGSHSVTSLNLSGGNGYGPNEAGQTALFQSLLGNTTLRILDFKLVRPFSEDTIEALCATLRGNISLTELRLQDVGFNNETVPVLLKALRWNSSLRVIDVSGYSGLLPELVSDLAREMETNRDLAILRATAFSQAPEAGGHIDLSNLRLSLDIFKELPFDTAWSMAGVVDLRGNPALTAIPAELGHLLDEKVEIKLDPPTRHWHPVHALYATLQGGSKLLELARSLLLSQAPPILEGVPGDLRGFGLSMQECESFRWTLPCPNIDLRDNPRLEGIPASLGSLPQAVIDQPGFAIHFDPPTDSWCPIQGAIVRSGNTRKIVDYARDKQGGHLTPIGRVKMMVVGQAAVGKTSLVRCLRNEPFQQKLLSTDGVDMGELEFSSDLTLAIWDFAGQSIYRVTHQFFLTGHGIYLLVYRLSDPPSVSAATLSFWLNSLYSRSLKSSKVILVGTHCDRIPNPIEQQQIATNVALRLSQFCPQLFAADQAPSFIVSCAPQYRESISMLRDHLGTVAASIATSLMAPPSLKWLAQWIDMQRAEAQRLQRIPVLLSTQLIIPGQSPESLLFDLDILQILGEILFSTAVVRSQSNSLLVMRPQWLANLFATVITTKHSYIHSGTGVLLRSTLIDHIWGPAYPSTLHQPLIDILCELGLFFPLMGSGDPAYLVPSLLSEEPPDLGFFIPAQSAPPPVQLERLIKIPLSSFPIAVIPHLLIRLSEVADLVAKWQQGCLARLKAPQDLPSNGNNHTWCLIRMESTGGMLVDCTPFEVTVGVLRRHLRVGSARKDEHRLVGIGDSGASGLRYGVASGPSRVGISLTHLQERRKEVLGGGGHQRRRCGWRR